MIAGLALTFISLYSLRAMRMQLGGGSAFRELVYS